MGPERKRLLCAGCLCLAALAGWGASQASAEPASQASEWRCSDGMPGLLERFAAVRQVRAHFVEEKTIALLAVPLVTEGSVRFVAPDLLLREQVSPRKAAMLLDGDAVAFRDGTSERRASLSAWQAAEGLISGYLDVLRGDASGLATHYEHRFTCEQNRWQLRLTPKTAGLKKLLRSMLLTGVGVRLMTVDMVDAHGDRTRTRFLQHTETQQAVGNAASLRARFARVPVGASGGAVP